MTMTTRWQDRQRAQRKLAGGEELRTGASGVPLALAHELHNAVAINRRPLKAAARDLGIASPVAARMMALSRRCGVPSLDRRIVLSAGYPDRTPADIAAGFRVTVDRVHQCIANAESIRRAEPLPTEYWEDVDGKTMSMEEIRSRALAVRMRNEMAKRGLPASTGPGAPRGEGVGGVGPRKRRRRGPRPKAGPAES